MSLTQWIGMRCNGVGHLMAVEPYASAAMSEALTAAQKFSNTGMAELANAQLPQGPEAGSEVETSTNGSPRATGRAGLDRERASEAHIAGSSPAPGTNVEVNGHEDAEGEDAEVSAREPRAVRARDAKPGKGSGEVASFKTCEHGTKKGYRCWQCGGLAKVGGQELVKKKGSR